MLAFMQGANDMEQLLGITRLCGPIEPQRWSRVERRSVEASAAEEEGRWLYRGAHELQGSERCLVQHLLHLNWTIPPSALHLMERLLTIDSQERLTALEAWQHDWFHEDPAPSDLGEFLAKRSRGRIEHQVQRLQDTTLVGAELETQRYLHSPNAIEQLRQRKKFIVLKNTGTGNNVGRRGGMSGAGGPLLISRAGQRGPHPYLPIRYL